MECKLCPKCGAKWMEGKHYWSTGSAGSEADLAGLVCDNLPSEDIHLCINPARGTDHGGQTWEYRRGVIDGMEKEIQRALEKHKEEGL